MATDISAAVIVAEGVKKIESRFEPGIPAMRDLDRLVKNMIGWQYAVVDLPGTVSRKIAMQFDHRVAFCDRLGAIYLYLIVVLSLCGKGYRQTEYDPANSYPHGR